MTSIKQQRCDDLYDRVAAILSQARRQTARAVNRAMTSAYWLIGREIILDEQQGERRADYGARVIKALSAKLMSELGKGFSERQLRRMRRFYLVYVDRAPAALNERTAADMLNALNSKEKIWPPPGAKSHPSDRGPRGPAGPTDPVPLSANLSWSHYRELMKVSNPQARAFYEIECERSGWSKRELIRQIRSLLFERLARSRDKEGVLALARRGHEVDSPTDLLKDPVVLEFVGLPDRHQWRETELEQALIDDLQRFLLELGRGFCFEARQKRLLIGGEHFFVDLVFYHRVLKCHVLLELKVDGFSHEHVGQLNTYVSWYREHEMLKGDNPPVGILLCTDDSSALVRYALAGIDNRLFVSKYQLALPDEAEVRAWLKAQLRAARGRA